MLNHSTITDAPLIAIVKCKNGNYSAFNLAGIVSDHESLLRDVSQREPTLETVEACVASSEYWHGPLVQNAAETERMRRIVPTVDFAVFTPRAQFVERATAALEAVKIRGESVIVGNHANSVRFEETIPALYARYNEQDQQWVVGQIILDKGEYSWAFPRWMPPWWTPERQFAISYTEGPDAGHVIAYETLAGARSGAVARKYAKPEVITVDLETGMPILKRLAPRHNITRT